MHINLNEANLKLWLSDMLSSTVCTKFAVVRIPQSKFPENFISGELKIVNITATWGRPSSGKEKFGHSFVEIRLEWRGFE